jgi:chromate transporter
MTGAARKSSKIQPGYSLQELLTYFLRLGTLGFGGPVALVGYMRRDLLSFSSLLQRVC